MPQPNELVLVARVMASYGGSGVWRAGKCDEWKPGEATESFLYPGIAKVWSFNNQVTKAIVHITIGKELAPSFFGVRMKAAPRLPDPLPGTEM